MTIGIAVTTAPRPKPTLERSLTSMRHAGFDGTVYVLSDSPSGMITYDAGSVVVISNSPPLGGLRNWAAALEMLVACTTHPWLMVVEDDVLWARGAAKALAIDLKSLAPHMHETGYLSLYLSNKVSNEISSRKGKHIGRGIYESRLGAGCWGSQAYVLPRSTATRLLADATFDDRRRNYAKNRNRDGIVSGCLSNMGYKLYYRVPCLVSHELGSANSSLASKPVQHGLLTKYWTGEA